MRRAALLLAVVAAASGGALVARAQETSSAQTARELHETRGRLAWRRAAWRVSRESFQRVVTELQRAREASAGRADFTTLFLLGISYLRLGRLSEADVALKDARASEPAAAGFPGLLFADALRMTLERTGSADEDRRRLEEALALFDAYLARLDGYDGAFAAELRHLGLVFRGRTKARFAGRSHEAVADLRAALDLERANGETPSSDVIAVLAQVHQALDEPEEARRLVLEALARSPGDATHYFNVGLIFAGTRDETSARKWFAAALARRPDYAEAHVKLAYLASKSMETAAMRSHLEAAQVIHEARARDGAPLDPGVQADLAAGFGAYHRLVASQRAAAGDEVGARSAYLAARTHFRDALSKKAACVSALNHLIQIAGILGDDEGELDELKRRLADALKRTPGDAESARSTFC